MYNLQGGTGWKELSKFIHKPLAGDEASILNVNQGSTGLYLERLCYDENGDFLEFDREYWLHDAIKLVVNIEG